MTCCNSMCATVESGDNNKIARCVRELSQAVVEAAEYGHGYRLRCWRSASMSLRRSHAPSARMIPATSRGKLRWCLRRDANSRELKLSVFCRNKLKAAPTALASSPENATCLARLVAQSYSCLHSGSMSRHSPDSWVNTAIGLASGPARGAVDSLRVALRLAICTRT